MMKLKILSLFILPLLLCLFPATSLAYDYPWSVTNFHSTIVIVPDGTVSVIEAIDVDFGNNQKHGIYRDIPDTYKNADGTKTYTTINVDSVTESGNKIPYEISKSGGYVHLKIGDADRLVSGKQAYQITYTAKGVLRSFSDYDELYWNVTGNQWEVPIKQSSAEVILPKAGVKQTNCYVGTEGSRSSCVINNQDDQVLFSNDVALMPGEGMTVAVGYSKGMVPIIAINRPLNALVDWIAALPLVVSVVTFLVLLVIGLALFIKKWSRNGRDQSNGIRTKVVTPEFEVPGGMRPAEIGLIIDERADTLDVSATIVDLAVRGYLTITEVPKKWLLGSKDYKFTKTDKDRSELRPYEVELLQDIFTGDSTETLVSQLQNTFYVSLRRIKNMLYDELLEKKLFRGHPQKIRNTYSGFGFAGIALGVAALVIALINGILLLAAIGADSIVLGLVAIIFAFTMPSRTAEGYELFKKAQGYKMFLSATEKYRQPYFEKEGYFMEILPYAMIFGVTGKLAKAFEQMGIEPSTPSWYYGTEPFSPIAFGSTMSSFSSSLSSQMASTPGGSGSGGSSGGGFGGGGGGSW